MINDTGTSDHVLTPGHGPGHLNWSPIIVPGDLDMSLTRDVRSGMANIVMAIDLS